MPENLLRIDFARPASRVPQRGWWMLFGGMAVCGTAIALVAQVLVAEQDDREALDRARAARPAPAKKAVPDGNINGRLNASLRVARSLDGPWANLFAAVESVPAEDVALISIEPSMIRRTVQITAEARNWPAMIGHLKALQSDSRLYDVAIVSHEWMTQQPGRPIRYRIQGAW